MKVIILWTTVCTLINLFALVYILKLRGKVNKAQKTVRHLSRSIQKMNSKNGLLWYQIAQEKDAQIDDEPNTSTGLTLTHTKTRV